MSLLFESAATGSIQLHLSHVSGLQSVNCLPACPCTMRFGSTAKVLAKCMLKYYRISECPVPHVMLYDHLKGPVKAEQVQHCSPTMSSLSDDMCRESCGRPHCWIQTRASGSEATAFLNCRCGTLDSHLVACLALQPQM